MYNKKSQKFVISRALFLGQNFFLSKTYYFFVCIRYNLKECSTFYIKYHFQMSVIWDTLKVQWMPWYIKVNCLLKHSTDLEDTNSANLEQNFYIYFDNSISKNINYRPKNNYSAVYCAY